MNESPAQLCSVTFPELDESLDFSPDADLESWRLSVPAKGACYAVEDAAGQPVTLATCGDLRYALVRRLGPQAEGDAPTKKIDFRAIVRRVRWRRVHSRFEANWAYLENARVLWPNTYRKIVKHWRTHWVAINLADKHPRFEAVDRVEKNSENCFGPFYESRSARRYVELLEDLFDLCRYHNILVQEPRGQPCAYKQMGRCPAPCDGSVTMESYREQLRAAVTFVTRPRGEWAAQVTQRMKEAAKSQRFEEAATCKRLLERAKAAESPEAAHVGPLERMRYVALQKGDRKESVRVFFASPGAIAYAGQIEKNRRDVLLPLVARRALEPCENELFNEHRLSLIAWHVLGGGRERGVFLPADQAASEAALREAVERVTQQPVEAETSEVGEMGTPDEQG